MESIVDVDTADDEDGVVSVSKSEIDAIEPLSFTGTSLLRKGKKSTFRDKVFLLQYSNW